MLGMPKDFPSPNVTQCLNCRKVQTVSVSVIKAITAGETEQWCNNCQGRYPAKNAKVYKLNI